MRAKIRDTEIFFDIDGAALVADRHRMRERPIAFLIHGGPGSDHTGLKARYNALKDFMQLVYFDHRGQGRSARGDPSTYTLDNNVEDMEALRTHLGVDKIVSIGTSYGGMVAMAHASRYPNAVSHLVLLATASHAGIRRRSIEIVAQRGTTEQMAACDDLWNGRLDTRERMLRYYDVMGSLYSRKYDAEAAKATLERAIFSPEALNQAYAPNGNMRAFDLRPALSAITAPTLIIAGRHDWICAPEFSEEIQRLIPGSELHVFENSSHHLGKDEPESLIAVLSNFIASTAQAFE